MFCNERDSDGWFEFIKWKVQKATFQAVEEMIGSSESSEDDVTDITQSTIKSKHFEQALSLVSPSVNKQVFSSLCLHH